jgi:hypothetical protein
MHPRARVLAPHFLSIRSLRWLLSAGNIAATDLSSCYRAAVICSRFTATAHEALFDTKASDCSKRKVSAAVVIFERTEIVPQVNLFNIRFAAVRHLLYH